MSAHAGRKPKLVLYPNRKDVPARPGTSREDFAIYASYRVATDGRFLGTLKVVRRTDGRLLFPFDGAEQLGPYLSKDDAIRAAREVAERVIAADLIAPEG